MRDNFSSLKWPYPACYGSEKEVSVDVLILGGGRGRLSCGHNAIEKRFENRFH